MKYRAPVLPLVLLLLLSACAGSAPRPGHIRAAFLPVSAGMALPPDYVYPAGDTIRVATWNVEHFVDAYDNPYIQNEQENAPDETMAERRRLFAEAIRLLNADVVVLEEFESAAFAEALAKEHFPEMGYRFFAGTESPTWYQNVVLMSRLPLGVVRSYVNVTTPVEGTLDDEGRPAAQNLTNNRLWIADVLARPGYTFALAGVHLKAGGGPRNAGWRSGQIRFLQTEFARLLALDPSTNLLVAGDFNTTPDSDEFRLLLNAEGPIALVDPLAGTDVRTHPAEAPTRRIDHILVNPNMLPELVPGSVRVATPLPIEQMAQTSDHLPVVATFVARDR